MASHIPNRADMTPVSLAPRSPTNRPRLFPTPWKLPRPFSSPLHCPQFLHQWHPWILANRFAQRHVQKLIALPALVPSYCQYCLLYLFHWNHLPFFLDDPRISPASTFIDSFDPIRHTYFLFPSILLPYPAVPSLLSCRFPVCAASASLHLTFYCAVPLRRILPSDTETCFPFTASI